MPIFNDFCVSGGNGSTLTDRVSDSDFAVGWGMPAYFIFATKTVRSAVRFSVTAVACGCVLWPFGDSALPPCAFRKATDCVVLGPLMPYHSVIWYLRAARWRHIACPLGTFRNPKGHLSALSERSVTGACMACRMQHADNQLLRLRPENRPIWPRCKPPMATPQYLACSL